MSDSDDLNRLADLHQRGALSDDEFARAKTRVLSGTTKAPEDAAIIAINAMRRSPSDRWIGGVCGGLARSTGMESWIWRLIFTLLALFGGSGLFIYALMWIFVPLDKPSYERLTAG